MGCIKPRRRWGVDEGARRALDLVRAHIAESVRRGPRAQDGYLCDYALMAVLCDPALPPADYARINRARYDLISLYYYQLRATEPGLVRTLLLGLADVLADPTHDAPPNPAWAWTRPEDSYPRVAPFIPLSILRRPAA